MFDEWNKYTRIRTINGAQTLAFSCGTKTIVFVPNLACRQKFWQTLGGGDQKLILLLFGFLPYISIMTPTTTRTARIEARISPDLLATVKRAAELQGRSVSDFVVTATAEAAQKIVTDAELIRLSRAASEKIAELLMNPPQPTEALKEAFAHRRRLIRDE